MLLDDERSPSHRPKGPINSSLWWLVPIVGFAFLAAILFG